MFAQGFRPFFLCAGVVAVVVMTVWLLGYTKRNPLLTYYGSSGWHAHEMLFGYMTAIIAGFLLLAVGKWSKARPPHTATLIILLTLWLAGRVLPVMQEIPPWLVAAVDFSFLPVLLTVLAMSLWRSGQSEGLFVFPLLMVLIAANALVHSEWLGLAADSARLGILIAIYTMVLLITIIVGRVMPYFFKRGIGKTEASARRPVIEFASVAAVIVLALADLFSPTVKAVVICAVLAAVIHAWRWYGWLVKADWSQSLLGALLAAYAWLILGFVLLAASYGGLLPHLLAFHAFMVGGFGGLTLVAMARLSAGLSGRSPRVSPLVNMAFVILNAAAVLRILGPLLSLRYGQLMITAAGALWIVSFVLFLSVYAPILMQARSDESGA